MPLPDALRVKLLVTSRGVERWRYEAFAAVPRGSSFLCCNETLGRLWARADQSVGLRGNFR